jgi:hypothetical protein
VLASALALPLVAAPAHAEWHGGGHWHGGGGYWHGGGWHGCCWGGGFYLAPPVVVAPPPVVYAPPPAYYAPPPPVYYGWQ